VTQKIKEKRSLVLATILRLRNTDELQLGYDETSYEVAAQAYYDWWENNKDKNFGDFKNIVPLEETDYRWH